MEAELRKSLNETYVRIKKGRKAFTSTGDGLRLGIFKDNLFDQSPLHSHGFWRTAELLIGSLIDSGRSSGGKSSLVAPIFYLYRHGIELSLKTLVSIGIDASLYQGDELTKAKEALDGHNLARLYHFVKLLIVNHWSDGDCPELGPLESLINEFHRNDPTGQHFRYEKDKSGRRYEYECLPDQINLEELRSAMKDMQETLAYLWFEFCLVQARFV